MRDDIARFMGDPKPDSGQRFLFGTVTQAAPLRIRVDGDTSALDFTPRVLGSDTYYMDDRVLCLNMRGHLIVMGPLT